MTTELAEAEEKMEKLYGKIFDLKASLGTLAKLMQDDIDSGRVRGTLVRTALLTDALALAKGPIVRNQMPASHDKTIPAPGQGALEGAPETQEPGSPESAGAPQVPKCKTCTWFGPLLVAHGAGICHERWRKAEWNEAVPLTTAGETCENHRAQTEGK